MVNLRSLSSITIGIFQEDGIVRVYRHATVAELAAGETEILTKTNEWKDAKQFIRSLASSHHSIAIA
jgi:hypothetical protein